MMRNAKGEMMRRRRLRELRTEAYYMNMGRWAEDCRGSFSASASLRARGRMPANNARFGGPWQNPAHGSQPGWEGGPTM